MNEIKSFFNENGFYVAKGLFSGENLAELQSDFDKIVTTLKNSEEEINARWPGDAIKDMKQENSVIYHTHNVQMYSNKWLKAFQSPQFLDVVSDIIGDDIVLHHSKLFQKPAGEGAPFPLHQDWSYFPTVKDTMIAGIIHLSEATDQMGCLRVYPGSHKLGRLNGFSGRELHDERNSLTKEYPLDGATILEAEPGDVVFFHYFTLHGSMPNTSEKTRKTVLAQFYSGSDKTEDGYDHPDCKLVLKGWNHFASRSLANLS